jgi:hypothetical protein
MLAVMVEAGVDGVDKFHYIAKRRCPLDNDYYFRPTTLHNFVDAPDPTGLCSPRAPMLNFQQTPKLWLTSKAKDQQLN